MYLLPFLARCIGHLLPFSFCYIVISSFAVLAGSVAPLWSQNRGVRIAPLVAAITSLAKASVSFIKNAINAPNVSLGCLRGWSILYWKTDSLYYEKHTRSKSEPGRFEGVAKSFI